MSPFRSFLFTPANRPDKFARALCAGADAVCLDLEDATPVAAKAEARAAAGAFLAATERGPVALGVRINARGTEWHPEDIAAVCKNADFVLLPKVVAANDLDALASALPGKPLWALVETAEGMMRAWEIAAAPVAGVLFGAFDYAADVGCTMDWEPLLFARSRLACACARAQIELLDAPSGDLSDLDRLADGTLRARSLGFTGRACIHPAQVETINVAFTPDAAAIAQARRVLAAYDAAGGAAAQLDGQLIERPVAIAARRVLARSVEP